MAVWSARFMIPEQLASTLYVWPRSWRQDESTRRSLTKNVELFDPPLCNHVHSSIALPSRQLDTFMLLWDSLFGQTRNRLASPIGLLLYKGFLITGAAIYRIGLWDVFCMIQPRSGTLRKIYIMASILGLQVYRIWSPTSDVGRRGKRFGEVPG